MIYDRYRYRMIDPGISSNYYEVREIYSDRFIGVLREETQEVYNKGIKVNIPDLDIVLMKLYEYYS